MIESFLTRYWVNRFASKFRLLFNQFSVFGRNDSEIDTVYTMTLVYMRAIIVSMYQNLPLISCSPSFSKLSDQPMMHGVLCFWLEYDKTREKQIVLVIYFHQKFEVMNFWGWRMECQKCTENPNDIFRSLLYSWFFWLWLLAIVTGTDWKM